MRVDGELRDLDEEIDLDKKFKHSIEIVVDRLVVRRTDDDGSPRPDATRMADSIETALRLSDGTLLVHLPDDGPKGSYRLFSERYACPEHGGSSRSRRPATSASTRRTARARPAPGSATGSRSTRLWSSRTPPRSLAEGAVHPLCTGR